MKNTLGAIVAVGVLGAALSAMAEPGPGGPGKGMHRGPEHGRGMAIGMAVRSPELAKEIGLTDEQVAKLQTITYTGRREMIKLNSDVETARLDVEHLRQTDAAIADIEKGIDSVAKAEAEVEKARARHEVAVRAAVGDEALEKLGAILRERRGEKREGRRERRSDRRGGIKGCGDRKPGCPLLQQGDQPVPEPEADDETED